MIRWSAALFLFIPAIALAHASLVRSVPANRAVLFQSPPRLQLWFNERLEPRYSSLSLSDSAGRKLNLGNVAVDPKDPKQISTSLQPLSPGKYVVAYRVLSVDGHIVQDQFSFTVKR
jgi:methionine-rich copper-binding protein CopC